MIRKIKVKVKGEFDSKMFQDADSAEYITGIDNYDGKKMWCDICFVYCRGKKYLIVRDCGKIVYCKEL